MSTRTLPPDPGYMSDPTRGASLGRRGHDADNPAAPFKFHLSRVRLNSGGYDSGGAYWGVGSPLYWACGTAPGEGDVEFFFRAADRRSAKAEVLRRHPNAQFVGG